MSDLTAQKHYNELIKEGKAFDFTKLTSTGISSNYEKVFEFAESYFKARTQANEDSKENEKALAINGVVNRRELLCDDCNKQSKYIAVLCKECFLKDSEL